MNLTGPELVMLYVVFGNEDAKREIDLRIAQQVSIENQIGITPMCKRRLRQKQTPSSSTPQSDARSPQESSK